MFGTTAAERCSCGLAVRGRQAQAFNEEAFRYLLGIQRRRAERANQPFLLVLVELKDDGAAAAHIAPPIAPGLLAALCGAFRETDLIGWYREEQTAGVILIERGKESLPDVSGLLTTRVTDVLARDLGAGVARRASVRICRIQPTIS